MDDDSRVYLDSDWPGHVLQHLYSMFINNRHCDVTVKCNGPQEFSAHSVMLSAASPVLCKSLADPLDGPVMKHLLFPDTESWAFDIILHFIYTGQLKISDVTTNNLDQLYKAAEMLEMTELQMVLKQVLEDVEEELIQPKQEDQIYNTDHRVTSTELNALNPDEIIIAIVPDENTQNTKNTSNATLNEGTVFYDEDSKQFTLGNEQFTIVEQSQNDAEDQAQQIISVTLDSSQSLDINHPESPPDTCVISVEESRLQSIIYQQHEGPSELDVYNSEHSEIVIQPEQILMDNVGMLNPSGSDHKDTQHQVDSGENIDHSREQESEDMMGTFVDCVEFGGTVKKGNIVESFDKENIGENAQRKRSYKPGPRVTCPHCQMNLLKVSLKNHIKIWHSGKKPQSRRMLGVYRLLCRKKGPHSATYRSQLQRTKCPLCEKIICKRNLKMHLKRHAQVKPIKRVNPPGYALEMVTCPDCGMKVTRNSLLRHRRSWHSDQSKPLTKQRKLLFESLKLQSEGLIDTSGDSIVCYECGKCIKKHTFSKHFKRVHPNKDYVVTNNKLNGACVNCVYCNKRILSENLNRHLKTMHADKTVEVKPEPEVKQKRMWECPLCKSSMRLESRSRHLRRSHPESNLLVTAKNAKKGISFKGS